MTEELYLLKREVRFGLQSVTSAGLSVEETAEAMKISQRTVMRDWDFAKVSLARLWSA
jgi:hypothetical protein